MTTFYKKDIGILLKTSKIPIIQILTNFGITLSKYYIKVKSKRIKFPDFKDYCPVCGKSDCARFLGFYYRKVVDEKGTYYESFPIARYRCRKGKKKGGDKTFSLLPCGLIPYSKYSVVFVIEVLEILYIDCKSLKTVLDKISHKSAEGVFFLNSSTVNRFREYVVKAINKILSCSFYKYLALVLNTPDIKSGIQFFLTWLSAYPRAPDEVNYEFYLLGGGYKKNSPFLFGTPYQFRK